MPAQLSTHVLDTAHGCPANGMTVELWSLSGKQPCLIKSVQTNADGRTDQPLLAGAEMQAGRYEIVFLVGDYFAARGPASGPVEFLDRVPVRFGIGDPTASYHVPLLVSPWIAEATWPHRPFANLDQLHQALCQTVTDAGEARQIQLIQAHPDLVGRAALQGALPPESAGEQASAGLNRLSGEEIALFQTFNRSFREKFGFPFVICARLHQKEAILAAFRSRLHHPRDAEIKTALEEIARIARLRLEDLVTP